MADSDIAILSLSFPFLLIFLLVHLEDKTASATIIREMMVASEDNTPVLQLPF